jgi:hypothetical protein
MKRRGKRKIHHNNLGEIRKESKEKMVVRKKMKVKRWRM